MSAPRVAIAPAQAILQLAWLMGYERKGEIPLFRDGKPTPIHRLPCSTLLRSGARLARLAHSLDLEESAELAIGLPRVNDFINSTTILWANVETKDSVWRASQFRPAPDIVLKMGKTHKRLLLWLLKNPISDEAAEAANRAIAYALHSPQKWAKPEKLRINLPGTFLRVGRTHPVPVLLTKLDHTAHTEAGVVGRLKAPPAPYAQRLREGLVQR